MARFAPADVEELAELLAGRGGDAPPLLATGAPHEADGGAASDGPPDVSAQTSAVDLLSTARLADVHALRPRDLTVTVGAGTRVEELLAALAEEGLWLGVSGTGLERSVGGRVAAADWDPLDASHGDLRRQLLACEVVTPAGEPARWGRAVLKDVAGYGVTRAVAGSRGTLGVLHRATFRLWPAPEADRVVALRPASGNHAALAARTAVSDLDAEVRPDAATWRWRPGGDPEAAVEVRLLGTGDSVELREGRLRRWAEEHGAEAGSGRSAPGPARVSPETPTVGSGTSAGWPSRRVAAAWATPSTR